MEDCFIICPLGGAHSEIRKKSDKILRHVFQPVLEQNEYKAIRADQIPKVGLITTQIINLILESPLVIADLTDSNPNVFYELAIRHAIRKPYIQVITKGQKIPFDLSGIRTIEIDITDLDNVEMAKKEIENQILEFKKGHIPDSPISVASSARLLQNDSDLAEEIAERLSYIGRRNYTDYSYGDIEKIDLIERKLWSFREFGSVNLEDLNLKLDSLIELLNKK
ncbi:hypothetical protein [Ulvibacter antarcticus]|uniref:Nucleoside 2-deoxyribosyltransferase-like protein n=1 Tax=Ulvibacter antarcticus TaxID=442714 RepID=A0A3L9Z6B9_9FLAO|nr:hypothetical protein [Ulvibacter antarcticus]RMA67680.1 hypothetical protein BXY75_0033 [Ulvibacter antarcticus]